MGMSVPWVLTLYTVMGLRPNRALSCSPTILRNPCTSAECLNGLNETVIRAVGKRRKGLEAGLWDIWSISGVLLAQAFSCSVTIFPCSPHVWMSSLRSGGDDAAHPCFTQVRREQVQRGDTGSQVTPKSMTECPFHSALSLLSRLLSCFSLTL